MFTVFALVVTGLFACTDPDEDLDGVLLSEDCDDTNASVFPGAPEACDGLDNNCDGNIDEDILGSPTWFMDADGDSYGEEDSSQVACSDPGVDWVTNSDDCDDLDSSVSPDGVESCNGADNDCNGWVDDDASDAVVYWEDGDGDGFGTPDFPIESCSAIAGFVANDADCDDDDPSIHPEADEVMDEVDNNCDGSVDEGG